MKKLLLFILIIGILSCLHKERDSKRVGILQVDCIDMFDALDGTPDMGGTWTALNGEPSTYNPPSLCYDNLIDSCGNYQFKYLVENNNCDPPCKDSSILTINYTLCCQFEAECFLFDSVVGFGTLGECIDTICWEDGLDIAHYATPVIYGFNYNWVSTTPAPNIQLNQNTWWNDISKPIDFDSYTTNVIVTDTLGCMDTLDMIWVVENCDPCEELTIELTTTCNN